MLPPSTPSRLAVTADVSATCAETSRGVRIPLCYAEALSMTSWTRTGQQGPPQRCLASRIIRGSRRSAEDVGSTVVPHCILTAHATALLHAEATPSRAPSRPLVKNRRLGRQYVSQRQRSNRHLAGG